MDTMTKEERHKNMAAIKNKNTGPEIFIRKLLFSNGYRYRKNYKKLPGHPDIWMAKYKTAIFINGCFWHAHTGCSGFKMPKSNMEFWQNKFNQNIKRDKKIKIQLYQLGIKELVIWECTVRKMKRDHSFSDEKLANIKAFLVSDEVYSEI